MTISLYTSIFSILASKGFWAEMLGVGDFYYEVSGRDYFRFVVYTATKCAQLFGECICNSDW